MVWAPDKRFVAETGEKPGRLIREVVGQVPASGRSFARSRVSPSHPREANVAAPNVPISQAYALQPSAAAAHVTSLRCAWLTERVD
jgi:hypothetical protein